MRASWLQLVVFPQSLKEKRWIQQGEPWKMRKHIKSNVPSTVILNVCPQLPLLSIMCVTWLIWTCSVLHVSRLASCFHSVLFCTPVCNYCIWISWICDSSSRSEDFTPDHTHLCQPKNPRFQNWLERTTAIMWIRHNKVSLSLSSRILMFFMTDVSPSKHWHDHEISSSRLPVQPNSSCSYCRWQMAVLSSGIW